MSTVHPSIGRLLAGSGGLLLIGSLFLPWSAIAGNTESGWDAVSASDVLFLITGICGLAAAISGGRFGFFRRDLSLNAMTDILGVVSGVLIAWLLLFDFPAGASPEAGVYLALAGAVTVATGAGDFRITSWFPRIPECDQAGT